MAARKSRPGIHHDSNGYRMIGPGKDSGHHPTEAAARKAYAKAKKAKEVAEDVEVQG